MVAEVYDFAREGASLSAILTSSAPFSGWDCAHQHHIESDKTPALRIFCDLFDPTIWAEMTLPRAKALGIDWLAGMTRVADIMVAGHRPPPDSEFVHQLSGVAEVNFDSSAIKGHIAGMDYEIGMLVGNPRRKQRPIVGEMWLVLAQMRVGNLNNSHSGILPEAAFESVKTVKPRAARMREVAHTCNHASSGRVSGQMRTAGASVQKS